MNSSNAFLNFPNNKIIELVCNRQKLQAFTTLKQDCFKVIETDKKNYYVDTRQLKQIVIDSMLMDYEISLNLFFNCSLEELATELINDPVN